MRMIVVAGVALLSIAGCSTKEPGTAQPSPGAPATAVSPSASPSGTAGSDSPISSLDPCSLLDPAAFTEFGTFGSPTPDTKPGARVCNLFRPPASGDQGLAIGVAVRDKQGLADANDQGAGKTEGSFNGRKALLIPDPGPHCVIALEVTAHSRVDVVITGSDPQQSCKVADKAANIVEPKLPKA
ncbi:Protein of unknown function [Amycolatopsis xylanica]|uniref:DUF3558 domain-containing protein n=1 Tax=Amycolatopsis xylanica TaxID=589385 RepID=A0A1H3SSJ4_9PSEU|nr:DUF3558 domain-containing protein [Amycolatopsis xylanica]SDZ40700.1 Protein of unknown function [Amycolatopsis xylanica]